MTSSYLLLEPQPGRSRDVIDALAALPDVAETERLYGEKVAARLEFDDGLEKVVDKLEALEAVAWACLYGGEDAEEPRRRLHASG